jgi:hypothetical protein
MKLAAVLKLVTPFLAADKKPADLEKVIIAADKAAKDGAGSGLGARELEEKDQARDKARDSMSAKDKAAFDAMSDEDKEKALDAMCAKDENDDPEGTNDEEPEGLDIEAGDPSTPGGNRAKGKTAIDSAEVDRRIAKAVAARDALHTAQTEVAPVVGVQAFDSAGSAYRAALTKLGVDVTGVHDSALPAMFKLAKDKAQAPAPTIALDTAGLKGLEAIIPGYGRLR